MKLGIHMRLPAGLARAAEAAADMGCEAIQVFSGNPNSWRPGELRQQEAEGFRETLEKAGVGPNVVHTAYLLNLASPDSQNYKLSVDALCDAIRRADRLGAKYVVTHIGSHKGAGLEAGVERVVAAVRRALGCTEMASVLLEGSSGGGNSIGSRFEELASLMEGLSDLGDRVGVCLDTAHLFGAGYDLGSPELVRATLAEFDYMIGLQWLKVLHLNDTEMTLGSKRDRHARIGHGLIPVESFTELVNDPRLAEIPGILETPWETPEQRAGDLRRIQGMRNEV